MASALAKEFLVANKKPYTNQAKLFLNAFWPEHQGQAEDVWKFCHKFIELDVEKKKEGSDLDEFNAHRLLEQLGETKRVIELRDAIREADINFDKRLSLLEFLLWRFKRKASEFVSRKPEDTDAPDRPITEDMKKANIAMQAVRMEIQRLEDKKAELQEAANGSGVKAMKAKNELTQLLTADPTDLNRALITAEAAVRKAGGAINVPPGSMWWMNRELEEMKKYKPQKKQ